MPKFVASTTPPTGCVVKTSLLAEPTLITTLPDVPDVSPPRVAASVYVPAAAVPAIWQLVKLATPATAATVGKPPFEHDNEPAPGPLLIANVTFPVSVVTTFPAASSTDTTGDIPKLVASATPPTGCVVNTSLLAEPTLITTLLDAPVGVSPARVAASV